MEKKQTFSVHTERDVKLTVEDIDDIMVAALEGGINYWCSEAEVVEERRCTDWGHEQIARGGALVLHDVEDIDEKWELDLEKFLNGFKLWVEQGLDEYGAVQKDGTVDCCQIDAACADEIVQLALFGEVTFRRHPQRKRPLRQRSEYGSWDCLPDRRQLVLLWAPESGGTRP